MARNDTTTLAVDSRTSGSSRPTRRLRPGSPRAARRLRREGQVPGVLYGGGGDPVCFAVGERDLRHALAGSGAVLELTVDGGTAEPAVLKDSQRHPVRGEIIHIDLLRVDLNVAITAVVPVELTGG